MVAVTAPATASPPFSHSCSCLLLLSAYWCLSFICVLTSICTCRPTCHLCMFMPVQLYTFVWPSFVLVWPTWLACSHPLMLVLSRLCVLALTCTDPVTCAGSRLFSVSYPLLPLLLLLLLPLVLVLLPPTWVVHTAFVPFVSFKTSL